MNSMIQTQLLKDILENNTLYEVEEIEDKLEYKLNENGEKVRICKIDEIEWNLISLCGEDGVCILSPQKDVPEDIQNNNLEVSFIPLGSIDEKNGILQDKIIKKYDEVSKGYTFFQEGDILFAKVTPSMENGNCIITKDIKNKIGFASTELNTIRCKDNVYNKYIWQILRSENFRNDAKRTMKGTGGLLRVPSSFFHEYKVLVPKDKKYDDTLHTSYQLQQSIAKNIGEKLINIKVKEQIVNKMLKINEMKILNLLQSYLTKDIIEIDKKKIKFVQKKLSQIVDIIGGNSQYNQDYYSQFSNQGEYPLFTGSKEIVAFIQPINENDVSSIEFCSYNKDNDAGSKAFYHSVETPCIIGGHHNKVIPKENEEINIKYLYYCLDLLFKTNMFYQSQQPIAGKEVIGKFEIYLPMTEETFDLQKEIVAILEEKIEEVRLNNIYLHKINDLLSIAKTSILKKG